VRRNTISLKYLTFDDPNIPTLSKFINLNFRKNPYAIKRILDILGYKKSKFIDIYLNGTLTKSLNNLEKFLQIIRHYKLINITE